MPFNHPAFDGARAFVLRNTHPAALPKERMKEMTNESDLVKAAKAALALFEYARERPRDAGYIDWQVGEVEKSLRAALAKPERDTSTDAENYRWLRKQFWDESTLCVVLHPKKNVLLGSICPSEDLLDKLIKEAREKENGS